VATVEGERFVRARGGDQPPDEDGLWFLFAGHQMLLDGRDGLAVPVAPVSGPADQDTHEPVFIGSLDGRPCMAALLHGREVPEGYVGHDLRGLYGLIDEPTWAVAGLAFQMANWSVNTRFCPRTGEPTHLKPGEWAKECSSCDQLQYPPVNPCVIVLVRKDRQILLTRQSVWPAGRYGLVAGYVEPGETLEHCLQREVYEETGITVQDIRYFASQPWPFPHQVMVGFTARYARGDIVIDRTELEDAAWFGIDSLPILPPPLSIARRLIDTHAREMNAGKA
jgi:NAD+ diphosphatase